MVLMHESVRFDSENPCTQSTIRRLLSSMGPLPFARPELFTQPGPVLVTYPGCTVVMTSSLSVMSGKCWTLSDDAWSRLPVGGVDPCCACCERVAGAVRNGRPDRPPPDS